MDETKKAARWLKKITDPETLEKITGKTRVHLSSQKTLLNTNTNTHHIRQYGELVADKYCGLMLCIENNYTLIKSSNVNNSLRLGSQMAPPNTDTVIPRDKYLENVKAFGLNSDTLKIYYKYICNGAN